MTLLDVVLVVLLGANTYYALRLIEEDEAAMATIPILGALWCVGWLIAGAIA